MGGEWQDLTGHAEGADAQLMAALYCRSQGAGVMGGYIRQIGSAGLPFERGYIPMGRSPELDGRVEELTAEPEPNHR
jgi:hypothetical protein